MNVAYQILIRMYGALIYVASLFSIKAEQWWKGRKDIEQNLPDGNKSKIIWFHCASLGEYEQAKPLISSLKSTHKECKILLTFFSPSGYLNANDNPKVDVKTYIPLDTLANAKWFVEKTKPYCAIFIKSELWPNFFKTLHQNSIPTFVVSAIFKPQHYLFKSYGKWHLKILREVSHFFVQNEQSKDLLKQNNIHQATVSGDNRYDKVFENSIQPREIPLIESFRNAHPLVVAGSTYKIDSKMLIRVSKRMPKVKFILAPHHTELAKQLVKDGLLYSKADTKNVKNHNILIIDSIGILSQLYQYANVSYVGGAFGNGLHNILEPLAFGSSVIFGPKHLHYEEAEAAIKAGVAQGINNDTDLEKAISQIIRNPKKNDALAFISKRKGANKLIIDTINTVL